MIRTKAKIEPKIFFKKVRTEAELKKLIDEYDQSTLKNEKKRLTNLQVEAEEDYKQEQAKEKERRREIRKARELISADVLDTIGENPESMDKLWEFSKAHPKQFYEFMNLRMIEGMKQKILKHIERKETEEDDEKIGEVEEKAKEIEIVASTTGLRPADYKVIHDYIAKIKSAKVHYINNDIIAVEKIPILGSIIYQEYQQYKKSKKIPITAFQMTDYLKRQGIDNFTLYGKTLDKIIEKVEAINKARGPPASPAGPPSGPPKQGKGINAKSIINDITKRLSVLIGIRTAGNSSPVVKNQIIDIIDWLLRNQQISKSEHKKISNSIL